jgi:hypothetical protein
MSPPGSGASGQPTGVSVGVEVPGIGVFVGVDVGVLPATIAVRIAFAVIAAVSFERAETVIVAAVPDDNVLASVTRTAKFELPPSARVILGVGIVTVKPATPVDAVILKVRRAPLLFLNVKL